MLSASKMATELFVKQGWKTPRWKEDEETRKAVWTTTTARQSLSGPTGAMETQPSSIQVSVREIREMGKNGVHPAFVL